MVRTETDTFKQMRGRLIIIQQLAIEWGILIMYFIGYGCTFIPGSASFRTAWGIQFVPCVLLMMGLPFLPRSPRWLAKVGRDAEAIQILADIQANGNKDDPLVIAEWDEIITTMHAERETARGWRKFTANGMWKRTLAGVSVQAWQVSIPLERLGVIDTDQKQQMSGANVMVYYMPYVFLMANLEGKTNMISAGVQYALFIM